MQLEYDFDEDVVSFEEDGVTFVEQPQTNSYFIYLTNRPGITSEIPMGDRSQALDILQAVEDSIEGWDD